jgi:hypothetical protein
MVSIFDGDLGLSRFTRMYGLNYLLNFSSEFLPALVIRPLGGKHPDLPRFPTLARALLDLQRSHRWCFYDAERPQQCSNVIRKRHGAWFSTRVTWLLKAEVRQ